MTIQILNKENKYYNKVIKLQTFIQKIIYICTKLTNKQIDICIHVVHQNKIQRIALQNFHYLIKDRILQTKYRNAQDIKNPTIISFVYKNNYADIVISVINIAKKYKCKIRNIDCYIKKYIAHSICNAYNLRNKLYIYIMQIIS